MQAESPGTYCGSVGSSKQAFAMHCYSLFTLGSLELVCIAQLGAQRRERKKEGRAGDGGRKKKY